MCFVLKKYKLAFSNPLIINISYLMVSILRRSAFLCESLFLHTFAPRKMKVLTG